MRSIRRFVSFLLFVIASDAIAQTGPMTTVAGTGTAGSSGDGGPAAAAQLNGPYSVAVDGAGNVYFTEWTSGRLRKISPGGGTITTVLGGPGSNIGLKNPEDVAVDAEGNLYVADSLQHRVVKIAAGSGAVTTIAGTGVAYYNGEGPATSAQLNTPSGVAVDTAGNLYIADQANHRIRKVSAATGLISTIAGTGGGGFGGDGGPATSAQMYSPVHLTIDKAGNLYIADTLNHRIRKVSAATGIITTVAGSGPGGAGSDGDFLGDGGPATAARLNTPYSVEVDSVGNLYIADSGNNRVRYVNASTGIITTIAGGGLNGDGCIAAASSLKFPVAVSLTPLGDRMYIADFNDNRLRLVTFDTTIVPPALASIAPATGAPGTVHSVTLTGSGFSGSPGSNSNCRAGETTVEVGGDGVKTGNVTVLSDTSLRVTLTIAADAKLGPRGVRVTTAAGPSNPRQFTIAVLPPAVPTLTSISPASGLRGSSAQVTLTGTNFDTRAGSTTVASGSNSISVGNVTVNSATSLTATFNIAAGTALGSYNVTVTTPGGSSNAVAFAVNPPGPAITYDMPPLLNPTENVPVRLSLANPSPDPVTGRVMLTFTPNATTNADDPGVTFISAEASARSVSFTFPPNTGTAQFSLPGVVLQAGTVAGTIRLSLADVKVAARDVTPSNTTFDVTIPRLVPVITSIRMVNRRPAGFDVEVTGYSTSRDITAAAFQFAPAAGANLLTLHLEPEVNAVFTEYYQSPQSSPAGSAFLYVQPFFVEQGNVNDVDSVTLTLANAQGASEPRMAKGGT
jgi:sugar lactone lactonase YvrE